MSPQAARANEMNFFKSNPSYAGCTNIGTDFLSTKLSTQLVRAIQQQLPVITTSIDNGCAVLHLEAESEAMLSTSTSTCGVLRQVLQAGAAAIMLALFADAAFVSWWCSIIACRKEVDAMGGQVIATRGGMIHLILQLCRQFEDAFVKAIDGGKGGEHSLLFRSR